MSKIVSYAESGKAAAEKIIAAQAKGDAVAKTELLGAAAKLVIEGVLITAASDWLTGYASAFPTLSSGKVRKSEAKTIFEAFAVESKELVLGMPGTVRPADLKQGEIAKETKSGAEWLKACVGGYHEFVALARTVKSDVVAKGQGSEGETVKGKKMTDSFMGKVNDRMATANLKQLGLIVESAMAQLVHRQGFEGAMFAQIEMTCNALKTKSTDNGHLNVASMVLDVVQPHLAKIAAQKVTSIATAKQSDATAPGPVVNIPVPAEVPKAAAESSIEPLTAGDQQFLNTGTNG